MSGVRSDDLPLSRSRIDRDSPARAGVDTIADLLTAGTTRVVHVIGAEVVTTGGDQPQLFLTAPVGTGAPVPTSTRADEGLLIYLGRDDDGAYLAQIHPEATGLANWSDEVSRRTDDPQGVPGGRLSQLRDIGSALDERDAGLATEAISLANWHATNIYCPRCGSETEVIDSGWVRRCRQDDSQHFPRTDAAVIMAIVDADDRLLLGHGATWPPGRYSVPAGFVEPGEPLEAAVRREVLEETGVLVGSVHYRASQPWPFPASLMVGFRGEALSTQVTPDGEEITAAQFVTRDELRVGVQRGELLLPRATSIAHHLIAEWYGQPLPEASNLPQ